MMDYKLLMKNNKKPLMNTKTTGNTPRTQRNSGKHQPKPRKITEN